MAAVLEKPDPASKYESAVDEQIAEATSRIRFHDLAFGGLVLAGMVLVYATAMILLDKYLVLPEWVRQASLVGFAVAVVMVTLTTVVRPFRRLVNPLYAAVQVEKTVENAKNSVLGYVEAKGRGDVHPSVKAAMSARAAKAAGRADVNRAVDHRSLLYVGAVVVLFLLTLAALFFVFRPTQFTSLLGRTFTPFSSGVIATRTQLTLLEPNTGDVTLTAGQSLTVKVEVGGRVPDPGKPDRVRVLLRHNPADPNYEELPLEKGDTARDWQGRVPDHLVRNGFWYKVAGGDAETPEYKVSVRSLPLFTDFEVRYEFPAYTRRLPETTPDAHHLEAYRGTKVTVTGRTNRAVKDGRVLFDPAGRDAVSGKPVAGRPDSLAFEFTLTAAGTYRAFFTSAEGERNADPPPFVIKLIEDFPPTVAVVKPDEEEIELPANGQLAVDGTVGDDFGIDRVTLKMTLGGVGPARALAGKPFQGGKSFLREKDGTWPRSLEYKDSVDFSAVTDADGRKVELKEGMVVEYWIEAADNRTKPGAAGPESDPNVGKSRVKRVRLTAPKVDPEQKQQIDERKAERKADEAKHHQAQQKKLDNESRDPKNAGDPPPQDPAGTEPPKNGDPGMKEPANPDMAKDGTKEPMPGGKDGAKTPADPKKGDTNPNPQPPGMSEPETAPPPSEKGGNEARNDAEKVQNQLDQEKANGGEAKPNPEAGPEDRVPPADAKPQPTGGTPDAQPKEAPTPDAGMNGRENAAAGSKPAGDMKPPEAPATPKPEPKVGEPSSPMDGAAKPSESKPAPQERTAGGEKGTPEPKPGGPEENPAAKPDPKQPMSKQDPAGGGASKPATQQDAKPDTAPASQKSAGGAGKPKPMPNNDPGSDKPPASDPPGGNPQDGAKPESGDAKPEQSPTAGTPKPMPSDKNPMPKDGTGVAKPAPPAGADPMSKAGGASEAKPDPQKPMDGTGNPPQKTVEKGTEKPTPDKNGASAGGGGQPKIDEKTKKDFEDAVKDVADKNASPEKKQAARDQLDKTVGKNNRKEIEDIASGLNSDKSEERQAAQQKLDDLKKQADATAKKNGEKGPAGAGQKPDPKKIDQALKDLNDPDQAKRDAAKEALDKQLGKGAGRAVEEINKGLKSDKPEERAAAQKNLDDLKSQAKNGKPEPKKEPGKGGTAGEPKVDEKAVQQALKDLNDPDPKKRDAAKQQLDEQLGKGAGDRADDLNKKLNSKDAAERAAAKQKIEEMTKEAEKRAGKTPKEPGQPKGKELSQAEKDDLKNRLDDLNSPDDAKRKAAEEEFDKKVGEENRKTLQEAMKSQPGDARRKAEEAKKSFDEMAKKAGGGGNEADGNTTPMGAGSPDTKLADAIKENAKNRAKSAELQLEQFEKNQFNKDLQEKLGWSQDQYDQFLDGYRKEVERLKKDAIVEPADATPPPPPPPAVNVGTGGKVEPRPTTAPSAAGVGGPAFAAPGFADAMKRFQEGATKVSPRK